jgi:hypothetical protein
MKSYCNCNYCKYFNEEFIVDNNTLICSCKRVYCTNCWDDANDEYFGWREDEDTIFGPLGEMYIDGCDNCNYECSIEELDRTRIPDETYEKWVKDFKDDLEYLERNKENYEKLKRALKNKK